MFSPVPELILFGFSAKYLLAVGILDLKYHLYGFISKSAR